MKPRKDLYSKVSRGLHRLRHAEDAEEGRQIMQEVVEAVSEQDKRYGEVLQNKAEHYIAFAFFDAFWYSFVLCLIMTYQPFMTYIPPANLLFSVFVPHICPKQD